MDTKQINKLAEQIYNIVSGADNRTEHDETVSEIETWLAWYDGNDDAEALAQEYLEYSKQN